MRQPKREGSLFGRPERSGSIAEFSAASRQPAIVDNIIEKAFMIKPAALTISRLDDGTIIDVNEAWQNMFGYSRDEVIGRSTLNLNIWPTPDAGARYAEKVRGEGRCQNWEQTMARKSGGSFITLVSAERMSIASESFVVSTWLDITESRQAEREIVALASFPVLNPNPVIEVSLSGQVLFANPSALELFPDLQECAPDHPFLAGWNKAKNACQSNPRHNSQCEVFADGRWYLQAICFIAETQRFRIYGLDITDRKQVEAQLQKVHSELEQKIRERTEELRRTNRTLRMTSECNQILVRAENEMGLIQDICRIIIDLGGYRMVWVGYAEDDDEKTVRPVASLGFEEGYLEEAHISWADTEFGRGPTGKAIRTQNICISRNFLVDPELAPWRHQALKRGFQSSISLPLKSGGKAFGALTIYSQEPYAFDQGYELLRELADDLAFGITVIRNQAEREHTRQIAEKRAAQLQALAVELVQAEQKERKQIAKILHDHLQQLLVGAKFGVSFIRAKAKSKDIEQAAEQLIETLDESIRTSRSLTADLTPRVLHEKGLAAGLEWLGRQMFEKHGLTLEVESTLADEPRAEHIRILFFEAVRELLLNIVKHAGVNSAQVSLRMLEQGEIEVRVSDKGAGFDPDRFEECATTGGFGLLSIRERFSYFGGRLTIHSALGQGSIFTLVAPSQPPSQTD